MISDNPFNLMYDELWEMVNRNPDLKYSLADKNKIDFKTFVGTKRNIISSDTPELMLLFTGFTLVGQNSSTTSLVVAEYTWGLTGGDLRLNEIYSPIAWELLRSMVDWDVTLCALKWKNSCGFVKRANITSGTSSIDTDETQNRQIRGWTGLYTIECECHFVTRDLRIKE